MKHISTLNAEEIKKFLNSFDHVLCDVDGVLLNFGFSKIPGSEETIKTFRKLDKEITVVSNKSIGSFDEFYNELSKHGYVIDKEECVIPVLAICDYLKETKFDSDKEIFVLASKSLKDHLREEGFKIAEDSCVNFEDISTVAKYWRQDSTRIGAVIMDLEFSVNLAQLQRAANILRRPDVIFLTGASDSKIVGTRPIIGPGYFQKIVVDISGRKSTILAKPGVEFASYLNKRYDLKNPSRVLFIGDSVEVDMAFAAKCGFQKLLVLSGVTKKEELTDWAYEEDYKPDFYAGSLEEFYQVLPK